MRLSVRLDILYKSRRAKKTFNFFVVFLTAISFMLAASALLLLSDSPTIKSVISGYEWLAVACFLVWFPSILWVLFDNLVDIASTNK